MGIAGNWERLKVLGAYLRGLRCQWLIFGDVIFLPAEFDKVGFLRDVNGILVIPTGQVTDNRTINYSICSAP